MLRAALEIGQQLEPASSHYCSCKAGCRRHVHDDGTESPFDAAGNLIRVSSAAYLLPATIKVSCPLLGTLRDSGMGRRADGITEVRVATIWTKDCRSGCRQT